MATMPGRPIGDDGKPIAPAATSTPEDDVVGHQADADADALPDGSPPAPRQ